MERIIKSVFALILAVYVYFRGRSTAKVRQVTQQETTQAAQVTSATNATLQDMLQAESSGPSTTEDLLTRIKDHTA